MSSATNFPLTRNAIRIMASGAPLPRDDLLVVKMTPLSDTEVLLYDDAARVKATVAGTAVAYPYRDCTCTVSVGSYVVSECNAIVTTSGRGDDDDDGAEPFLYVANVDVLQAFNGGQPLVIPAGIEKIRLQQGRVQGGTAFAFLRDFAPFMSNEALSGSGAACGAGRRDAREQNEGVVTEFLSQHSAVRTLVRSNSVASDGGESTASAVGPTEYYMSALGEFKVAQMDRQKASLSSQANKVAAERAGLVADKYGEALSTALEHEGMLTPSILCRWHGILCGGGLHAEAGNLRRKAVRVGNTHFCHPSQVRGDLDQLCLVIRTLEARLLHPAHTMGTSSSPRASAGTCPIGLAAATFAAAVFFGIVDIHPFADGNGRLARISLCWALKQAGLPFVVNLFATASQRAEYTKAVVMTRRNVGLVSRGAVSQESQLAAYTCAGVFKDLVDLILDRVAKSIAELQKLVREKSSLGAEEAELQAAKRFRERASAGACMICFDDNPNIATLCCGKAVHLNCIAEWLSSHNSCPQCRAELPLVPRRSARAGRAPSPPAEEEEQGGPPAMDYDNYTTTASDDDDDNNAEEETATTMMDDEEEETASVDADPQSADTRNNDVPARDEATTTDDSSSSSEDEDPGTTEEVEEDEDPGSTTEYDGEDGTTEEDSTAENGQPPDLPPICAGAGCHNRAARDCSNNCCGRCCVMYGQWQCERHCYG